MWLAVHFLYIMILAKKSLELFPFLENISEVVQLSRELQQSKGVRDYLKE